MLCIKVGPAVSGACHAVAEYAPRRTIEAYRETTAKLAQAG
jgi:hypothetical protein